MRDICWRAEQLLGSLEQARSNCRLLPVSLCYVARVDIWSEQVSFNPFLDEAEV